MGLNINCINIYKHLLELFISSSTERLQPPPQYITLDLESPQYLALQDKYSDVCEAIERSGHINEFVELLTVKHIIGKTVMGAAFNALSAAQDPSIIVYQVMQAVGNKISLSPKSFYHFCDVLDISPHITVPISDILRKECGVCVCVCVCVCVYLWL